MTLFYLLPILGQRLQVKLAELAVEHVALLPLLPDDVRGEVHVAVPHRRCCVLQHLCISQIFRLGGIFTLMILGCNSRLRHDSRTRPVLRLKGQLH